MFTVLWKRQGTRWFASVDDRGRCGGVWRERGCWRGEVWPRGRDVLGAYYSTLERAQQQVVRYITAHPMVADVVGDPRGGGGKGRSRPDWRLAEYLRS